MSFLRQSVNRNFSSSDCIYWFLSIFSILSRFSFLYWLRSSFIDIHCFFSSVTNLHSCSGCSSPLPPPQSSSAGSPPGALVTPVNWFIGAVLRYWGCVTSIILKCFPHMSHLKFTWDPGYVSASPTYVVLIPFRRFCVVALITLELFQISVSIGSFGSLISFFNWSGNRNLSSSDCSHWFLSILSIQ